MRRTRDSIEQSRGNVFEDLGLANPDERMAKAKLMLFIKKLIEQKGLTQVNAADLIGVSQSDISNIMRGRGRTYTMDRLFDVLHGLGARVTIEAQAGERRERIAVFG